MNTFILSAFLAAVVALSAAAPGHYGAYNAEYGFVAAGYPHHGYGHGHGVAGAAKVQAAQNNHAYSYGLNENGPHYSKHVHQSGNFAHSVAVPVAHAVPVVHAAPVHAHAYAAPVHAYAGHGHGLAYGHAY